MYKDIQNDIHNGVYLDSYKILAHDVDAKYDLKPSAFFRYLQETANHQMRDCKPTYEELFAEHKAFILSRMCLNVYETPTQYDEITVRTWPCVDKGVLFNRCYQMVKDGRVIAESLSLWALVDTEKETFIPYSAELFKNFVHSDKLEGFNLRFRMPKEGFEKKGSRKILYNDTDINGHMNNTVYPDILSGYCDVITEKKVSSVSIAYLSEAKLGDEMDIYVASTEENGKSVCYVRSMIGDKVNVEAKFIFE